MWTSIPLLLARGPPSKRWGLLAVSGGGQVPALTVSQVEVIRVIVVHIRFEAYITEDNDVDEET